MSQQTTGQSGGPDSPIPNVAWQLKDSVSACPAGDSVIAGHPGRLRILVWYDSTNGEPKVGVPPESIYIGYGTSSGNAKINDKAVTVIADDSTDANGQARITIPSLSGSGNLAIGLYVSGVPIGSKTAHIRTTDPDASGRDELGSDQSSPGDIDWSGGVSTADYTAAAAHLDHWRRNALHGALVRRTNYCETCPPGAAGARGGSLVAWSPSQRFITHSGFIQAIFPPDTFVSCKVMFVPSNPADGNARTQTTSSSAVFPFKYHDYDPNVSPLNLVYVFDVGDSAVIRKGVPWGSDTSEVVITAHHNTGDCFNEGDNQPAISPDGQWIAFSRCNGTPPGTSWGRLKLRYR